VARATPPAITTAERPQNSAKRDRIKSRRYYTEASASLPGIAETPSPETVFDGMELQRLRLHHDQQVPEWE
jgi:hypothetical protein